MKLKRVCQCSIAVAFVFIGFKLIYLNWLVDADINSNSSDETSNSRDGIDKNIDKTLSTHSSSSKNLLLYWGIRWNKDPWPPEGFKMDNCIVTYDRSKVLEAKAIVFHATTLSEKDFPWKFNRSEDQLYIWWNSETPVAVFKELSSSGLSMKPYEKDFFNWTMTYRLSADVVWGYGYRGDLLWKLQFGRKAVDEIIAGKTSCALMVTSNCGLFGESKRRIDYAKTMLQENLNITLRGSCFGKRLSDAELIQAIKSHKFFFAFENSLHCRDYITEKFWHNSLKLGAVPVVMGPVKEDVLKVAPPNSFIFAEDFPTPNKLAAYLRYLDEKDDKYREYFMWREDDNMTDEEMIKMVRNKHPDITPQERPARLCEKVLNNKRTKIIKSLRQEIVANDPTECL